jgi:VanZ family protein
VYRNKKIRLFIAILWTVVITVLSLATISSTIAKKIEVPYKDKYIHFTFYFFFVIFWCIYFNIIKKVRYILFAAIGFGILMEICQGLFTKTRSPDLYDVVANSVGAFAGFVFVKKLILNRKATY